LHSIWSAISAAWSTFFSILFAEEEYMSSLKEIHLRVVKGKGIAVFASVTLMLLGIFLRGMHNGKHKIG
jgi:hypothetical protein